VAERVPISDEQPPKGTEAGRYTGRSCVLPREAPGPAAPGSRGGRRKPNRERGSRSGEGTGGGRSTGSTEEAGPRKPGNRAEDKTLRTKPRKGELGRLAGAGQTREAVDEKRGDDVGEPNQRRSEEARETKRGKGEIKEDAEAGAPRRLVTLPASARGRSFPVSSDDRRSRRKET